MKKIKKKISKIGKIAGINILFLGVLFYMTGYTYTTKNGIGIIMNQDNKLYKTNDIYAMNYVFIDTDNTAYKIFGKNKHGAAVDWSFLFGGEKSGETKGEIKDTTNQRIKRLNQYLTNFHETTRKKYHGENFEIMVKNFGNKTMTNNSNKNISCILPRGKKIDNKSWILAYQQRSDEPSICNIQKRTCNNGKLSGTYTQQSCKKNIPIITHEKQVKLYNIDSNKKNSLTQTANRPNKVFKSYNIDNKLNTIRDNTTKTTTILKPKIVQQTTQDKEQCFTPRGERINNGQFIKAYKKEYGFSDKPCEVELRICLNGNLQGHFQEFNCTHIYDYTSEERYSNPDNQ